jgi:hypothetical protein
MIEQEYIMLIMNCKKYVKKAAFQKRTWLPLIPSYLKFYHVIGDETMSDPYMFDNENQVLWVRTLDDYNSLPKKVINAYEAVLNTFQLALSIDFSIKKLNPPIEKFIGDVGVQFILKRNSLQNI